jgi:hypothetical protein
MPVRENNELWVRKLDGDMHVVDEQPKRRLYPSSLVEADECVQRAIKDSKKEGLKEVRAVGSHWAISHTAVTTGYMFDNAVPVHEQEDQDKPRLNHVLYDVIPPCLSEQAEAFFRRQYVPTFDPKANPTHSEIYLIHVEAGMRIHELYSVLDKGDAHIPESLAYKMSQQVTPNNDYSGPWALETMGGAGGQTITGAFSTATHGGDVKFSTIAEMVVAIHLISANGDHHWIERTRLRPSTAPMPLVDEAKLRAWFEKKAKEINEKEGAKKPTLHVHRSDEMMNAVVVSCGRMGFIYSVVLRAVRQFALDEKVEEKDWNAVKALITAGPIFSQNRFVEITVNPYGTILDPSHHWCYITTRNMLPLADAGTPPKGQERGLSPGVLQAIGQTGITGAVCDQDHWVSATLTSYMQDVESVRKTAAYAWGIAGLVIAAPFTPFFMKLAAKQVQAAALSTITWATGLIALLGKILEEVLPGIGGRFGDTLAAFANFCSAHNRFDIFRLVMSFVVKDQKMHDSSNPPTPAISYAVMDRHDYQNVGCVAPGDSVEIFFDATSPSLFNFIENCFHIVRRLENGEITEARGAFGGYISMRFMAPSDAYIAMQKSPLTCSIEIAGLSKVNGSDQFIAEVEKEAIKFGAILHWGPRNDWTIKEVEQIYNPNPPWGDLYRWREVLSQLTEHGQYDLFSTAFSKQMGLEITTPIIEVFSVSRTEGCHDDTTTVSWNAIRNPPETKAYIEMVNEQGALVSEGPLGLIGNVNKTLGAGRSTINLVLERELTGEIYRDERSASVRGFRPGDEWNFTFTAQQVIIDGSPRWTVLMNLGSSMISNSLRVTEITSTFGAIPEWTIRNNVTGDLKFTVAQNRVIVPNQPVFNTSWTIFSKDPVGAIVQPPILNLAFKLTCQH